MTKLCHVDGTETVTKPYFQLWYVKTIWLRFVLQEAKLYKKTVGDGFCRFCCIYSFTLLVLNSRCACFCLLATRFFSCSTTIYWTSMTVICDLPTSKGWCRLPTNQSWPQSTIICPRIEGAITTDTTGKLALIFLVLCNPFENMIVLLGNATWSKTSVGKKVE